MGENVFNGRATMSGHMNKRRPLVDSTHQLGLKSQHRESSDCNVDGIYGGQSCQGGILKIGKWENVFNGGATTSSHMDKQRPQQDLARRIGLRSHPLESSDCSVDV